MADRIEWSFEDTAPDGKLPADVMVSILTYLPVKSLMKFKAVSKHWYSLISSSRFSKLRLHRQSLAAPNYCLMLFWVNHDLNIKYGLLDISRNHSNPADNDVLILDIPPEHKDLTIIDSCNGLVCLGFSDLILWNPATRKYRSLDLPKGDNLNFSTLGLCYVDAIDDFKILVWNHCRPPFPVLTPNLYVYSLSSDSWDKMDYDNPKCDIHFTRPTFMVGCMHWLSHTCPNGFQCTCTSANEIVAFDVIDGAVSWYRLPVNCSRHRLAVNHTLVIGGCLSFVSLRGVENDDVDERERGFEVWVMEEYGVEGSWVKRFFIQEEFPLIRLRLPIVSWIDSEIVVRGLDGVLKVVLIFYDSYSEKKRYVEFSSYRICALFKYVENLASVERGGLDSRGDLFIGC